MIDSQHYCLAGIIFGIHAPRKVNDMTYKVQVLVEHLQSNFQKALTAGRMW